MFSSLGLLVPLEIISLYIPLCVLRQVGGHGAGGGCRGSSFQTPRCGSHGFRGSRVQGAVKTSREYGVSSSPLQSNP